MRLVAGPPDELCLTSTSVTVDGEETELQETGGTVYTVTEPLLPGQKIS